MNELRFSEIVFDPTIRYVGWNKEEFTIPVDGVFDLQLPPKSRLVTDDGVVVVVNPAQAFLTFRLGCKEGEKFYIKCDSNS